MNLVIYYFAACVCVVLKLPTGSLHFWGPFARAADGMTGVWAFSLTSSAKSPPSGLCEPEGSGVQFSVSTFLSETNSSEPSQKECLFPRPLKLILSSRAPRRGT